MLVWAMRAAASARSAEASRHVGLQYAKSDDSNRRPQPAQSMNAAVNIEGIKWSDAPPVLPKGAQIAVISGDPSKEGLYVIRLKMPANYRIPAHNHPTAEYVTVISGVFGFGMGDKLDDEKGMKLNSGGFAEAPAKMNHFGWTTEEAIVQVHGQGPFVITYVDPADDPSKK